MPNKLSDALTPWAENQEFRKDAAQFLSLSEEAIDALLVLIEKHATFDVPTSEASEFEARYELARSGRGILAAAQLIRSAVRRYDNDEHDEDLIDFANSVGVNSVAPARFRRLFRGFRDWTRKL